jgi:hypothetical protein
MQPCRCAALTCHVVGVDLAGTDSSAPGTVFRRRNSHHKREAVASSFLEGLQSVLGLTGGTTNSDKPG